MPAAWPETLPHCLLRGKQEGIGDGRLVSQNDIGPPKVRPRSSATPDPFAGSFRATGAQIEILRTFVKTTLAVGSLPFTIASPRGGDDWLVLLDAMPSWDEVGPDAYIVHLSLLVLP